MSGYFMWIILTAITGSPLGSAVVLILFWLGIDRVALGIFPDPVRWVMRWRRTGMLERTLVGNPHDGRARLELAQLYVERGKGKAAVDVLRPTFDTGADDIQSVFTMGEACLQAGYVEQGEKLLEHAEDLNPDFRVGEIHLVRGRQRLARGDFQGAKSALETLVKTRRGTITGRGLLSKAMAGLGDDAGAALMRDEAWNEYVSAPRFQRRKERLWAWRARPSRPATYLLLVILGFGLFATVVAPKLSAWARTQHHGSAYSDPSLDDPDE
jgi:hypothetical protein